MMRSNFPDVGLPLALVSGLPVARPSFARVATALLLNTSAHTDRQHQEAAARQLLPSGGLQR